MGSLSSSVPAIGIGGITLGIAILMLIIAAFKIVIGILGLPFGV